MQLSHRYAKKEKQGRYQIDMCMVSTEIRLHISKRIAKIMVYIYGVVTLIIRKFEFPGLIWS